MPTTKKQFPEGIRVQCIDRTYSRYGDKGVVTAGSGSELVYIKKDDGGEEGMYPRRLARLNHNDDPIPIGSRVLVTHSSLDTSQGKEQAEGTVYEYYEDFVRVRFDNGYEDGYIIKCLEPVKTNLEIGQRVKINMPDSAFNGDITTVRRLDQPGFDGENHYKGVEVNIEHPSWHDGYCVFRAEHLAPTTDEPEESTEPPAPTEVWYDCQPERQ